MILGVRRQRHWAMVVGLALVATGAARTAAGAPGARVEYTDGDCAAYCAGVVLDRLEHEVPSFSELKAGARVDAVGRASMLDLARFLESRRVSVETAAVGPSPPAGIAIVHLPGDRDGHFVVAEPCGDGAVVVSSPPTTSVVLPWSVVAGKASGLLLLCRNPAEFKPYAAWICVLLVGAALAAWRCLGRMRLVGLLLVSGVAVGCGPPAADDAVDSQRLVVWPGTFVDLGLVPPGKHSVDLMLRNEGREAFEVHSIRGSCECMGVRFDLPAILAPSQELRGVVLIDVPAGANLAAWARVSYGDGRDLAVSIQVAGEVPNAWRDLPVTDAGLVPEGEWRAFSARTPVAGFVPRETIIPAAPLYVPMAPGGTVRVDSAVAAETEGGGREVRVEGAVHGLREGQVRHTLRVGWNHHVVPVPLTWRVVRVFESPVSPVLVADADSRVLLPPLREGFRCLALRPDPADAMEAHLEEREGNRMWLRITPRRSWPSGQVAHAVLTVSRNDSPVLEVKIAAVRLREGGR